MQAVKLGVVLAPAEVWGVRQAAVAFALRSAVATVAGVSPSLVFIASVVDKRGGLTMFDDSDPANTAGDATGGADDDLNTVSGGGTGRALQEAVAVAAAAAGERRYALRRVGGGRALALALVPGGAAAAATTPAGGLTVTLNVVAGTGAAAAAASTALAGAEDGELMSAPLQALAIAVGAPYPGNFTGGLAKGSLSVVTLTRRRTRWGALVAFLESLSVGAIAGIVAGVALCLGLVGGYAWLRVRRAKGKRGGGTRVAPEPLQQAAAPEQVAHLASPQSLNKARRAAAEVEEMEEEAQRIEGEAGADAEAEAAAVEAATLAEEEEAEAAADFAARMELATHAEEDRWGGGSGGGGKRRQRALPHPPRAPPPAQAPLVGTWAQRRNGGSLPRLQARSLPPLQGRLRGGGGRNGGEAALYTSPLREAPLREASVTQSRQTFQFAATTAILRQSQALATKSRAGEGGRRRGGRMLPRAEEEY